MKRFLSLLVVLMFIFSISSPNAATTSSSAIKYKTHGLNYSPYIKIGQSPDKGSVISQAQLKDTIKAIAPYTKWIRTFGCTGSLANVGKIAHQFKLKVAVGAWLSKDLKANNKEIASLIKIAKDGQADTLIIGSETLLRGDLTKSQLINYINKVKKVIKKIPITTDDTVDMLIKNPTVISAVNVVFVNIYPYWEGVSVKQAVRSLNTHYQQVKKIAGTKKVVIGETGWPSSGTVIDFAVPSVQNAAFYFKNFVSWARAKKVEYFYFEAFNEAWKVKNEGPQGGAWGIWNKDKKMKVGMMDVFKGIVMKDNWTVTPTPKATPVPTPTIQPYNTSLPDLPLADITEGGGGSGIHTMTTTGTWRECSALYWDLDYKNHPEVFTLDGGAITSFAYRYEIFQVKGAKGGEEFEFGLASPPWDYLFDSVTTEWQTVVLDLSNRDPSYIYQVGFVFDSSNTKNAIGATTYVDNIRFSNSLPSSPYVLANNSLNPLMTK
ncbi:MAG: glycosyl hydrolase family 17 protein [Candidatus Shapirobacteria bacterium]